jgi:hypothetical protein
VRGGDRGGPVQLRSPAARSRKSTEYAGLPVEVAVLLQVIAGGLQRSHSLGRRCLNYEAGVEPGAVNVR